MIKGYEPRYNLYRGFFILNSEDWTTSYPFDGKSDNDKNLPEPVTNLDGQLLTTISTPSVPQGIVVSLMRWVDGRHYTETNLRPHHAKAWGQLTGRMHQFAAQWAPPDDFKRFQ